ncbi:hypothetical protein D3C81_2207900 [compost metagenome]
MFERSLGDEVLLLAFNLSGEAVRHALPPGQWHAVALPGPVAGHVDGDALMLPGHAVYCARRG